MVLRWWNEMVGSDCNKEEQHRRVGHAKPSLCRSVNSCIPSHREAKRSHTLPCGSCMTGVDSVSGNDWRHCDTQDSKGLSCS